MSDDLVKRLRYQADEARKNYPEVFRVSEEIAYEAADRIEKLEEQAHYANGVADLAMKHRNYAEQRVEKLEAALRKIMNLGQSAVPDHWEARCLARDTARKALEGES